VAETYIGAASKPGINQAPPPGYFSSLRYLGTLGGRYWICVGAGATLVVVDPHSAIERLELDRMRRSLDEHHGEALQRPLFAAAVDLGREESAVLLRHRSLLERLGLELEPFGGSGLALKSLPPSLIGVEPKPLLETLAGELSATTSMSASAGEGRAMRVIAGRAAAPEKRARAAQEGDRRLQRRADAGVVAPCAH